LGRLVDNPLAAAAKAPALTPSPARRGPPASPLAAAPGGCPPPPSIVCSSPPVCANPGDTVSLGGCSAPGFTLAYFAPALATSVTCPSAGTTVPVTVRAAVEGSACTYARTFAYNLTSEGAPGALEGGLERRAAGRHATSVKGLQPPSQANWHSRRRALLLPPLLPPSSALRHAGVHLHHACVRGGQHGHRPARQLRHQRDRDHADLPGQRRARGHGHLPAARRGAAGGGPAHGPVHGWLQVRPPPGLRPDGCGPRGGAPGGDVRPDRGGHPPPHSPAVFRQGSARARPAARLLQRPTSAPMRPPPAALPRASCRRQLAAHVPRPDAHHVRQQAAVCQRRRRAAAAGQLLHPQPLDGRCLHRQRQARVHRDVPAARHAADRHRAARRVRPPRVPLQREHELRHDQ
jgi:hypothetical protein